MPPDKKTNTIYLSSYSPLFEGDSSTLTKSMLRTYTMILLHFSLSVKATTLIFISGCGSAISSAKEGKSGFIYNLVKS